jgi:hypothetical protein
VSYNGNKGTHLQTIAYQNVIDSVTGKRPHPEYGQVEYRTNDGNSIFHALQVSVHRNLSAGWLFAANYMWSHAINDGSLGGGETDAVTPQNVFCRACERASSDQDVRHFFSANSVYQLPFGAGRRRLSSPGLARDSSAVGRSARSLLHGVEGQSTSRSHVRYPMSPMGTTCLRGRTLFPAFLSCRPVGKPSQDGLTQPRSACRREACPATRAEISLANRSGSDRCGTFKTVRYGGSHCARISWGSVQRAESDTIGESFR